CGRLEVVQWLADRCPSRSRLLPGEGDDSLLHAAARHGQVEIASWCADRLLQHRAHLEGVDRRRDTALHLAAGAGNTLVCRALLDRGAAVTARNACGLKPYDVAAQTGHHACAEYLLTFETLADLAGDFCSLEVEAARLSRDNADYKDNFREVLSVARRLLRERAEMHAALRQLRDDWQLLQERLLRQLQLAAAERHQLRRQLQEADPAAEPDEPQLGETDPAQLAEQLSALLDRWQQCSVPVAETALCESQSRLQVAETAWHRLRASRKEPAQPLTEAQEIVRNKIGDIRAQAAPGRPLDSSAFSCSDEDSLIEVELLQGTPPTPPPRPPGCAPPPTPHHPYSTDRVPTYPAPATVSSERTSTPAKASLDRSFDSGVSGGPINSSFQALSVDGSRLSRRDLGSRRRSQRSSAHLERRGKSADPIERSTLPDSFPADGEGALWPPFELSRSLDWSEGTSPRRRPAPSGNESVALARAELRRRLRQLALVSESGSAAVLDVIEPSGSEAGSAEDLVRREVEAQRRARARSAPPPRKGDSAGEAGESADLSGEGDLHWLDDDCITVNGDAVHCDSNGNDDGSQRQTMETEPAPQPAQWRASLRTASPGRCRDTDGSERRGRTGRGDRTRRSGRVRRETGTESSSGRERSTGTGGDSQTVPEHPTPPSSVPILSAPDILQGTRHWRDPGEDSDEASPEKPDLPLFQLGNTTPSAAAAAGDAATAGKKRSFLQKFSIRARWTPKKRDRPARPGQEITAVDFRETYSSETRDDTLSVQESVQEETVDDPPPLLLPRSAAPSENGRVSRESRHSQGEVRPAAEPCDAAGESRFLDGDSTADLFTAVCVSTYADSASESSRSAVSRRSRQSSSPGRPLLSGGQPPYRPPGRQSTTGPETVTGSETAGVSDQAAGLRGAASRPASSASVVLAGRHSPAASETSHTESTQAPASDVSVTESARHLPPPAGAGGATMRPLGGGGDQSPGDAAGGKVGAVGQPMGTGQKSQRPEGAPAPAPLGHTKLMPENGVRPRRSDRPWYEISDDD
ncbi:treacle protein-like, partial [Amphibalanus amphitrite]